MPAPTATRPSIPDGYGLPETEAGQLTWEEVEQRLVPSLHYWLATVRPDGTPHLIPRWGVWVRGRFWYDGAPTTRHALNLRSNPAVTLSLEDGKEAVMIEGLSEATSVDGTPGGMGEVLASAFAKYHDLDYAPGPDSWFGEDGGGLRVITPRKALAWFRFPTDCTRFTW